jgi:eukaryotic-like serine/threonine-protein kinase
VINPLSPYKLLKPEPEAAGDDPLLGRLIQDKFRIESLLARGGMGRVYRAVQEPLGRVCAIKVVNAGFGTIDPEFQRRFFLEASVSSKLSHPNTVTVFDYGKTEDDMFYMAMELLEGKTLHRALRDERVFTEARAIRIVRQICKSLREAHGIGVVHRDLKPANVFLTAHGDEADFVKVLDFGLVKNLGDSPEEQLTQTGLFMGSPKYMAPEQIEGRPVDGRTDLYSLGIIFYEMLTGKVPFDKATSVATLMAHVNDLPPKIRDINGHINPTLDAVVMKCLEKRPSSRFDSMNELLVMLGTFDGASQTGPHDSRHSSLPEATLPISSVLVRESREVLREAPAVSSRSESEERRRVRASRLVLIPLLSVSIAMGGGLGLVAVRLTQTPERSVPAPVMPAAESAIIAAQGPPAAGSGSGSATSSATPAAASATVSNRLPNAKPINVKPIRSVSTVSGGPSQAVPQETSLPAAAAPSGFKEAPY